MKTWQGNALRPITLPLPHVVTSATLECRAFQGDINELVESLGHYDLLYLDPPYNTRQYSAYYHVPELIGDGDTARLTKGGACLSGKGDDLLPLGSDPLISAPTHNRAGK